MTSDELQKLDVEIHRKVFGKRVELCENHDHWPLCVPGKWYDCSDLTRPKPVPNYSTDIAAAFVVFEELARRTVREPWCSENTCIDTRRREWHVVFGGRFEAVEETAPLAICKAAIRLVRDKE